MPDRTSYGDLEPFITKDGSIIREFMRTARQSLAEAIVPAGQSTLLHRHIETEEFYHITAGEGLMRLGREEFTVKAGDTVNIAPGTMHRIENTGGAELRILCMCTPPYEHEDTELECPEDL
jgi:mannose-6-phosphate isomerase-like protein (cupin superfamily)